MEQTTQNNISKPLPSIKTKIAVWWMILISGTLAATIIRLLMLEGRGSHHTIGIEILFAFVLPLSLIHLFLCFFILKRKRWAWWLAIIIFSIEEIYAFLSMFPDDFSVSPFFLILPSLVLLFLDRKNFFKIASIKKVLTSPVGDNQENLQEGFLAEWENMNIKQFLRPDWKKIVIFILLFIISTLTRAYLFSNNEWKYSFPIFDFGTPFVFCHLLAIVELAPKISFNFLGLIGDIIFWYFISCSVFSLCDGFKGKKIGKPFILIVLAIIIGGGVCFGARLYLDIIGGWSEIKKTSIIEISVDGKNEETVATELPIGEEVAIHIVRRFCEPKYPLYQYDYENIKKVDNKWIVRIPNINCICGATFNVQTGETKCQVDLLSVDKKLIYPDDFILKNDEIPSDFQLKVISKESMELISLTRNPGFFDNERYSGLFVGADPSKIEKFHASFYIKPESPLTELGIFVIEYKSKEDCDFELTKLKVEPREDSSYLRNEDILVMIWSDGGAYQKEIREISNKLKVRLNLETIVASTEVRHCMEEAFPVVDFKNCIPGKVIDGWTEKVLYPNTLDTSDIDDKKRIDSPIPEKVKDAAVALYNSSMSVCKNSWLIKESGKLKEVSQIEFCEYVIDYLYSCNKCLLEWEGGCC